MGTPSSSFMELFKNYTSKVNFRRFCHIWNSLHKRQIQVFLFDDAEMKLSSEEDIFINKFQ